jgi:hypothetical protein
VKISGQVVDKQTDQPVSAVVVYTSDNRSITMTDDDGRFTLEAQPSEPVYFRQLAYDFLVTSSDSLVDNPKIYLTRHVVELKEAVVSPYHIYNLLRKAERNTRVRLLRKEPVSYLFHLEGTLSGVGDREAYALINETLNIDKKGKMDWRFDLLQFDKIKDTNKRTILSWLIPYMTVLFPMPASIEKNYKYEILQQDDDCLKVRAMPVLSKKKICFYMYTVNMRDTVLTEAMAQSVPKKDVAELFQMESEKDTLNALNIFSGCKYTQDDKTGAYVIKEFQNILHLSGTYDKTKSIAILRTVTAQKLNSPVSTEGRKTKKIKPNERSLFGAKLPNSPGFWKKYQK